MVGNRDLDGPRPSKFCERRWSARFVGELDGPKKSAVKKMNQRVKGPASIKKLTNASRGLFLSLLVVVALMAYSMRVMIERGHVFPALVWWAALCCGLTFQDDMFMTSTKQGD